MSNPSKRKGTSFEVLVRDYFIAEWDDRIVRVAQAGANDLGDLANFRVGVGDAKVAVECKNIVEYKSNLSGWITEATREAQNINAVAGIVVHKRAGKGRAEDQYVTLTLADFFRVLRASQGRGSVSP